MDAELVRRIERAALWAWPPKETAVIAGWLLRAGGGNTRRVSSAQTHTFEAGADLDRAIPRVEAWYEARDLPPCFQLTDAAEPPGLDEALAARGYARMTPSTVLVGDLATLPTAEDHEVELLPRASQAVLNALADPLWSERTRRARAALLTRIRRPHRFGLVFVGPEPAAGGLCVAHGELAGVMAMRTQAPYRRRGLARRVLGALAGWAAAQGACTLYLQVEDANAPARALYEAFGLGRAYGYAYRERPG
mgnify:CR=1 FL=1